MTVKGGSELCNEYSCWTLLQYHFYYMAVINDPFVEYIKNWFSRYSSFLWQYGLCEYFPFKTLFCEKYIHPINKIEFNLHSSIFLLYLISFSQTGIFHLCIVFSSLTRMLILSLLWKQAFHKGYVLTVLHSMSSLIKV